MTLQRMLLNHAIFHLGYPKLYSWTCTSAKRQKHTAALCNTLQHAAMHCNTLQYALQCTAMHCSTLQPIAIQESEAHYSTLQHTATLCSTLQHPTTPCNTLQHTVIRKRVHTCTPLSQALRDNGWPYQIQGLGRQYDCRGESIIGG